MELNEAREFARGNHRAVMHTFRRDGSPQLSPVTVGVNPAGRLIVSTRETSIKAKNLARDPRVSLCLMNSGFYGQWLQADGIAHLVHLPDAMEPLVEYYRLIGGEHPDWDDYRAAMLRDKRVLVEVELTRVGPDFQG